MSDIALIPRPRRTLSKAELQAYAIKKTAEEESRTLGNKQQVRAMASKYEQKIAEERRRLGLCANTFTA